MAPATKTQPADGKPQLNQRETEVIAKAFRCIVDVKDGVVQIDSAKLAKIGGYASADSARHVWKPIANKLIAMASDLGDDDGPTTPSKAKPKGTPRKRKTDTGADPEGTPTKKRKAKAVKAKVEKDDSDEEAEARVEVDNADADGEA
ncbi:hypothetical protein F5Y04DRAFT_281113 [Hypomontagnella monticulosa]|nr:hypothetical protein F5Y04DRAFT_281113 [Hypomontagnella monticulosa]